MMIEEAFDTTQAQRRIVLRALLVITVLATLFFGTINAFRGVWPVAVFEYGVGAFSVWLFFSIGRTDHPERWALVYLILFATLLGGALSASNLSQTIFVWIMLLPTMAFLLLGRHQGLLLSLVFMVLAWAIYLWRNDFARFELLDWVGFTNIVGCGLVITGTTYAYEYAREKAQSRLNHLATTDPLTGLPNRQHLRERLETTLAESARSGLPFGLLAIDLDYFKRVNDEHGHDVGDQVLQHVARVLRGRLRKTDTVARWGGEEFLVLLRDTPAEGAAHLADTIRDALRETPYALGSLSLPVSGSIGIAIYPEDGHSLQELLIRADQRMYAAKKGGRDQVVSGGTAGAMTGRP